MKEIITEIEKLNERVEEIDPRKENSLMREIILELKEIVRDKNLVSLSAPQIGYNKRIFIINFKGDLRTFINPIITEVKGFELSKEQCPSLPGKTYIRPRNNDIKVVYLTPLGKIQEQRFVGKAATVFQHEVDHLDGLLISDIGLEIDDDFEKSSEEERLEIINAYMDSLDIKHADINKKIEEDENLKQMSDAIEFMTKVQKGEVQFDGNVTVNKNEDDK
ncbi:peptide deformylase [uncultured Clostridium sp.]|uniref:peptide deformylase n=1 Tax=uncultured Clostridium sp. TaxID=59620 RepID=UPI00262563FB|nr:peptide deformylase [uncultured Clostridium sp.]